jgi:hypothetical protein
MVFQPPASDPGFDVDSILPFCYKVSTMSFSPVCHFYLQGVCQRGARCKFEHPRGAAPAMFTQQSGGGQHRRVFGNAQTHQKERPGHPDSKWGSGRPDENRGKSKRSLPQRTLPPRLRPPSSSDRQWASGHHPPGSFVVASYNILR